MTNITNKLISEIKAKELCDNYDTKAINNKNIIGKDDNRSSWFSIVDLKAYITYIENEAKTKNINIDGIRLYMGAYSNNKADVAKKKLSTIFLTATTNDNIANKSDDVTSIKGMNLGSIGQPPSKKYGQ